MKERKTEIIYTRVKKPNRTYLDKIARRCHTSLATTLDHAISFMRESISDQTITEEIAKRRNKIQETSGQVS